MCGIAGFYNYSNPDREKILALMTGAIASRGPDGDGTFISGPAGLGHRRLSIIDLETGAQPMLSHDKRYATVFNGEIYNYIELREELAREGCVFLTHSDTEVIAESIRRRGIAKAVLSFRGMFAFAVYDTVENTLFLARDRTGIKPLYYAQIGEALVFGSEIKALKKVPELPLKPDLTALHDYFTIGYPITPRSFLDAVKYFPPAHYGVVRPGGALSLTKYWQWKFQPEEMSFADAACGFKNALSEAVRYHLRSDVPLAAFLSGGIDSSLVVKNLSAALGGKLKAFTASFDEDKYDESAAAKTVADICGCEHNILKVSAQNAGYALFEKIMSQYDEPFGDSSCLPTYLICEEMRKHVKTVFSGDGGDELFGGYSRYSHIMSINRLRLAPGKILIAKALRAAAQYLGEERARQFNKALAAAGQPREQLFCGLHTYFSEAERGDIYTDYFKAAAKDIGPTWRRFNEFIPDEHPENAAEQLMGADIGLNLHGDYLKKVDIASSAHGLEVRVPFLDNGMLDFAARLPLKLKIHKGEMKYLLRYIASHEISPSIGGKPKQGFGIPFDRWCNQDMLSGLKNLLFSRGAEQEGVWRIIKKEAGEKLWARFTASGSGSYSEISRYQIYQRIFMLASAQIWMAKNRPELPEAPVKTRRSVKAAEGPRQKLVCLIGQLGNGGSERQLYLFSEISRQKTLGAGARCHVILVRKMEKYHKPRSEYPADNA